MAGVDGDPHEHPTRSVGRSLAAMCAVVASLVVIALLVGSRGGREGSTTRGPAPPSIVFPPDGTTWFPLRIPGSRAVTGTGGETAQVVELRGWLSYVGQRCVDSGNTREPDWHYNLELDPRWLDRLGVKNPNTVIRAGNVVNFPLRRARPGDVPGKETGALETGAPWVRTNPLTVHVEATSWDPRRHLGQTAPEGWRSFGRLPGCPAGVLWPFDPRNPGPGQPALRPGHYVRMVGSLVTDQPHAGGRAQEVPDDIADAGFVDVEVRETVELRQYWQQGRSRNDPTNPARWTEMHPPDLIEVLAPTEPSVTARAVVAAVPPDQRGPGPSRASITLSPPGSPPASGAKVKVVRILGPATRWPRATPGRARRNGVRVSIRGSHAAIELSVGGNPALGYPESLQAVLRVEWG